MTHNRMPFQVIQQQTPQQTASAGEYFHNSRYLQVHFEHLHESNQRMQNQLAEFRLQIERLNRKLERMQAAIDRAAKKGLAEDMINPAFKYRSP